MSPSGARDAAPLVLAPAHAVTAAGYAIDVPVTIVNTASEARVFLVSALGVDADWLPPASRSNPIAPGAEITATITLRPSEGTLAARYPLLIAVQALDVATGDPRAGTVTAELDLLVDAPAQVAIALEPADSTAVFGARLRVVLTNSGARPETVRLEAQASPATSVSLPRHDIDLPPNSSVLVRGRLRVERPALLRRRGRHAFMVTARTTGAPRYAEGSLTTRPVIGPFGAKLVAGLAIVAVWVALALLVIPKLADSTKAKQVAGPAKSHTSAPATSGGNGGSGSGGNGGSGNGGSGTGGSGSGGTGGSGSGGGAPTGATNGLVRLNGTVSGPTDGGVTVSIASADVTTEADSTHQTAVQAAYKLTPSALTPSAQTSLRQARATTKQDGAWSLSAPPVGLYTLTFAKAGYQEQRFQIDTSQADATKPMAVTMVPGTGSMSGSVTSAAGPVKGATITISDGTNVLSTSTNSTGGGLGDWSVTGLSTPSTYLVSASAPGLGTVSRLVAVPAKGSPTVDLTMSTSVATLSGTVHGGGAPVGAAQVTATDGTTTRSVSTVSEGAGSGTFVLPGLTLGTWSVTVQASGYQLQSRQVKVVAGRGLRPLSVELNPSTVTVSGSVKDVATGDALAGAGLVLSNAQNTYKQTALNDGSFAFDDVAPGTYSLSAEYFGYVTGNQSVKAVVGKTPHPANFRLVAAVTHNDSAIQGFVGNAAASGGSIGCQTTPVLAGCTVFFTLQDRDGATIPTTVNGTGENSDQPSVKVDGTGGALAYTLAIKTSDIQDGLAPGSYTLTISSTGFLPATINVRVPLNGTAIAPQVNLFPANTISGVIGDPPAVVNTDINPDDLAAIGPDANCMLAVPVNYTGRFDSSKFGCNATTAHGYDPTFLDGLTKRCTDTGVPVPTVGMIGDDGHYTIPGLCDGTYYVLPVIGNPAFDASRIGKVTQTVVHGQTLVYSPHLPRRPVLKLAVSTLQNGASSPTPLQSTQVHVECRVQGSDPSAAPAVSETVSTTGGGLATVFGMPTGPTVCSVATTAASDVIGRTDVLNGAYDNDVDAAAVIVEPLPPVFGKVVSQYAASDTNPVSGAALAVTAVTGYVGSDPQQTTSPLDGSFTTNANGCFAVARSVAAAVSAVPSGCGQLAAANVLVLTLAKPAVSVAVGATVPTSSADFQPATLAAGSATQLTVSARTVDTSGLSFTSAPTGLSMDGATVAVTGSVAHGSGTLNPTVNPSGQLIWNDSSTSGQNLARQGTYNLTLKVPGFTDTKAVLTCGPNPAGTALTCALDNTTVSAYASIGGRVVLDGTTTAVGNATVIAHPCSGTCPAPTGVQSGSCPTVGAADYATTTDGSGRYSFVSPTGARYLPPGQYQLVVCATGLITAYPDAITAAGGANTAPDIAMKRLGAISGRVSFSDGTTTPPAVTVTLEQQDSTGAWGVVGRPATTDSSGYFALTDGSNTYFLDPSATRYRLTYVANGYQQKTVSPFPVASGDNSGSVTLTARGGISGTVVSSSDNAVPITSAQVTLRTSCTTANGTVTCTGSPQTVGVNGSGEFTFTSGGTPYFLETGTSVQVSVTATNYKSASTLVTVASGNTDVPFQLDLLGAVSGQVTEKVATGTGPGIGKATVTAAACTDSSCKQTDSNTSMQAVADGGGNFAFQVAGASNVFSLKYWKFTVTATGYQAPTTPITLDVASGANTLPIVMTPLGTLSGTVSSAGSPTDRISGVSVTAQRCQDDHPTVCDGATEQVDADEFGKYSFTDATNGTPYVLDPGHWQITVTAFGYLDTVTSTDINSGANTLALTLQVRTVVQPISVQISGDSTYVKHATVTLRRNDDLTHTDILTTRSGDTYTPPALRPTAYTAYITGDNTTLGQSIVPTSWAVPIPLVNVDGVTGRHADTGHGLADTIPLTVSVLRSTISGSVAGRTGASDTSKLGGISVQLVQADGTTPAVDTGDNPIDTTTDPLGNFSLGGIPNGTYSLRVNGPDPDTGAAATNGWVPLTTTAVAIGYGQAQSAGTIALDPVKALVDVTVSYSKFDVLGSAAPTLTPASTTGTWAPIAVSSTNPGSTSGAVSTVTYEFTDVPNGCWSFALNLSSAHTGKLGMNPITGNTCTAGYFPVDKSGAKATASYALDEGVLTITSTVTPNPADTTTTPTVRLKVTTGTTTVKNVVVTDGTVTTLYLPTQKYSAGLSLDSSTPRSPLLWPLDDPVSVDLTLAGSDLSLTAAEADLESLQVTHFSGAKDGTDITVSVRCDQSQDVPAGCDTFGTVPALTQTDTGTGVTFPDLAPGTWSVQITGTLPDIVVPATKTQPATTKPGGSFTKHQVVTLTKTSAGNSTTNTWLDGPAPAPSP